MPPKKKVAPRRAESSSISLWPFGAAPPPPPSPPQIRPRPSPFSTATKPEPMPLLVESPHDPKPPSDAFPSGTPMAFPPSLPSTAPNSRPSTPTPSQNIAKEPASQAFSSEPTATRIRSPSIQSVSSVSSQVTNEPTLPKPARAVSGDSVRLQAKASVIHPMHFEGKPSTKPSPYSSVEPTASLSSAPGNSPYLPKQGAFSSPLANIPSKETPSTCGHSPVVVSDEKSVNWPNDYANDTLSVRPVQDGRAKLLTILREFSKQISVHTQGSASATQGVSNSLRQDVQAAYRRFRLEVHRTAPRFRPWEANFNPQSDVLRRMIEKVEVDDATGAKGAIMYINDVMTGITRSRVDDPLGGVPFSVKESLVKEAIKEWRDLARGCAIELLELLFDHLDQVLTLSLGPKSASEALLRRIRDILNEELKACLKAVEERIDFIYAAEEQIFTLNDQLYMEYRTKWLDRYGALLKQSREGGMSELLNRYATPEFQKEDSSYGWVPGVSKASATKTKIDSLIEEFAALGVQIKVSDLAKLFPADPMEPAIQLIAEVRAYFDVAYRRFGDAIPQQLHLTYLRGFDDRVDLAFSRFVMGLSPSECADLLSLDLQPSRYASN